MTLTTSPPLCAECHGIWEPKPPGTLWATPGLLQDSFTFTKMPYINRKHTFTADFNVQIEQNMHVLKCISQYIGTLQCLETMVD